MNASAALLTYALEREVDVISGGTSADEPTRDEDASSVSTPARHYGYAVLFVGLAVGVAILLRRTLALPDLEMLFLLPVMLTAAWFGRGPSIVAAALGVACYDFFLVPPYYTFTVDDRRYFLTFAMMFGVSFTMSELAGRLRRQQREARSREERTTVLYSLTRELAAADQPDRIAGIAARHAADVFSASAVVLGASREGELSVLGAAPDGVTLDPEDLALAESSYERDELVSVRRGPDELVSVRRGPDELVSVRRGPDEVAGPGTDALPKAKTLCAPLRAGQSRLGVLVLEPTHQQPLRTDQRAFLDVFCRQVAVALERVRLFDEARQAALRAKTEEMRSSLLSAVSHDLRTPLASITGAATALRDNPKLGDETKVELVESIVDEAERLERLVANLLDMTRLETGGVVLTRDWVPLDEVVGSALTRLEQRLGSRQITVAIAPDIPLLLVDPVLFEQLFVNLIENADKYTPAGTSIEIRATADGDEVAIDVIDHGPGLPVDGQSKVFEKFYRGPHVGVSGAGLGLPICKGIVEAHGGTIIGETRASGGAIFRIRIPTGGTPPSMLGGEIA